MTRACDSILAGHAFVRGLSPEQIQRLAEHATQVTFAENEIALPYGDPSDGFYFLVSGSVVVELRTARYAVCVQALSPGDVFGWSALLDDHDTLFQVKAREVTAALRIEGVALKSACNADPLLGKEVLRRALAVVAGRVRATEIRFAEMCGIRV